MRKKKEDSSAAQNHTIYRKIRRKGADMLNEFKFDGKTDQLKKRSVCFLGNGNRMHRDRCRLRLEFLFHNQVNSRFAFEQKGIFKKKRSSTVRGERRAQNPQTKQKGET